MKNENWDGHKEVENLVSRVPELYKIRSRFEKTETEYKEKPYDDKYFDASDQNDVFDDILWNFVYYGHELQKELGERPFIGLTIKEEIFENAKKYLDSKYLHTPHLTNAILVQVIDTELVPLEHEINGIAHPIMKDIAARATFGPMTPIKYTKLLPFPWNKIVSFGLSLIS
ncbi:MAG: hypothetical protein PHH93_07795 [Prolixibacteraceae bacterium]|nr:hypothetical protein [Prolixibacteraceae bacterium]